MSDKQKKKKPHFLDEVDDSEYLGNIWGWKFSFISLAVITVLSIYVLYSYATVEVKEEQIHQELIQENRVPEVAE